MTLNRPQDVVSPGLRLTAGRTRRKLPLESSVLRLKVRDAGHQMTPRFVGAITSASVSAHVGGTISLGHGYASVTGYTSSVTIAAGYVTP